MRLRFGVVPESPEVAVLGVGVEIDEDGTQHFLPVLAVAEVEHYVVPNVMRPKEHLADGNSRSSYLCSSFIDDLEWEWKKFFLR